MVNLLKEIAKKHEVDPTLITRLIDVERTKVHLERRRGVKDELRVVLEKYVEEKTS